MTRNQNMTLGQMRRSGTDPLHLICENPQCAHAILIDPDCWPRSLRLSDIANLFTCPVCGHRGADVGPASQDLSAEHSILNADEADTLKTSGLLEKDFECGS